MARLTHRFTTTTNTTNINTAIAISDAHISADTYDTGVGFCGWLIITLSWVILISTFPISVCFCVKVVQEYERAVIFRLGRLIGGGAKGPGKLFFVSQNIVHIYDWR
uniref:Transmembrane protein n=1 Tax=Ascaris lumbricoides TaxID=6252 RepID=A0A0M3IJ89_ASCLU